MTVFISHVPRPLNSALPLLHLGGVRSMEHIDDIGTTVTQAQDNEAVLVTNAGDSLVVVAIGPEPDASLMVDNGVSSAAVALPKGEKILLTAKRGDLVDVLVPAPPAAFVIGDWSVADNADGTGVTVTVAKIPDTKGYPVEAIFYKVGSGGLVDSGLSAAGEFVIPIEELTLAQEATISLVIQTSYGNSAAGDDKTVTPTDAP